MYFQNFHFFKKLGSLYKNEKKNEYGIKINK